MRSRRFEDLFGLLFSPDAPVFFLVGLALSALLGNALYQLLVKLLGESPGALAGIALGSIVGMILFVVAMRALVRWRERKARVQIDSAAEAEPRRGLIVLVSAGSEKVQAAPNAIRHHLETGTLKFLWLVASPEADEAAANLKRDAERDGVTVFIEHIRDAYDGQETYLVTRRIYENLATLAADPPLAIGDLIVDITGGVRPQEAGALLAAEEFHCALQYMKALRDERGGILRDVEPRAMKVEIRRK